MEISKLPTFLVWVESGFVQEECQLFNFQDGFMTSEQLSFIEQKVLDLLAEIRPNAVSLVDAFDFRDHHLCSILGRYDGQVYSNMYEWAQRSPLNKTEVHLKRRSCE